MLNWLDENKTSRQHAINAIWQALRTYNVEQLIKFITSLKRSCFEMPNGTYSQRLYATKKKRTELRLVLINNKSKKCGVSTIITDNKVMKFNKLIFLMVIGILSNSVLKAQWVLQQTGTTETIYSISPVTVDTVFAACSKGIVLKTTDGGVNWVSVNVGTTNDLLGSYFFNSKIGWVVGVGGVLFKTIDGGVNWVQKPTGTTSILYKVAFVNDSIGWSSGVSSIIKKSINGGDTWVSQSASMGEITALKIVNENTGWIAGQLGRIRKTTNGGSSWNSQTQSFSSWITDACFLDENIGWMCGRDQAIIKTTNGGENWTRIYPTGTIQFNSLFFVNENTGWAITSDKIFVKTTNGGTDWTVASLDNIGRTIRFINDTTGWIGGYNGAIYKTSNGGVITGFDNNIAQNRISLYPNPASDIVTFNIDKANNADLTLNIFNVTGTLVKSEILKQNLQKINIGDLKNGIYMVEIKSKEWTEKQKLIIER